MSNRRIRIGWWIALAFLLAATFVKAGEAVPWRNEFFYLIRLVRTYQPSYIPLDWTLSTGAPEHFAFNHIFGWLGLFVPIDVLGWLGRSTFWALNLWLLLGVARRLSLSPIPAALALALWIGVGQSLVGHSWIFGTFEAKVVAYAFVHLGLLLCLEGRFPLAGLMAGLSFTLHPSVGLWGGLALAGVVAFRERNPQRLVFTLILAVVGALPGLLAVLPLLGSESATADDWRLMVLVKMPHHLDPESWPRSHKILLALMLVFNAVHARATGSVRWTRLVVFQFVTFLPFVAGVLLRRFEAWEMLSYFPFRLFPLYTPLFFGFALGDALLRREHVRLPRPAILLGVVSLVAMPNPFSDYLHDLGRRLRPTPSVDSDLIRCYRWIREELPADAQGLAPPGRDREFWYHAERGLVVCSEFQTYHHLSAWRERVESLGGEMTTVQKRRDRLYERFVGLGETEMGTIVETYAPDFVVTPSDYDLPVGFVSGSYRVYLPESRP